MTTLEIEVEDELGNCYETEVVIKDGMDEADIEAAITDKAKSYCSRNGLSFESWNYEESVER